MPIRNRQAAVDLLNEYEGLVNRYEEAQKLNSDISVGDMEIALRELDIAVKTVINAVNTELNTDWYPGGPYFERDARKNIQKARGAIQAEERLASILGPQGPQMYASALHPVVWDSAAALWADGHPREAVQRAATFTNALVQAKVARSDVSDKMLMTEAFSNSDPEPGKPRLRWPGNPSDQTVKSMNEGLRLFAPGVFATIRNPATHSTVAMDEQEALEQLAALSLLCRWVDQCKVRILR
jgi:hypothetical protein